MVEKSTVAHVANLARLKITDQESEILTGEMNAILGYIDQLNAVNTEGVEPTAYTIPEHDPLRDDIAIPSLSTESALSNGPSVKKGHFAIPKVIG